MAKSPQFFAVYYVPYTFHGASVPHGLKYCLRVTDSKRASELLQKGCSCCFEHGIVFGDWTAIEAELPEMFKEWSQAGSLPYLPAPPPIDDFQGDCLRPRVIRRRFRNDTDRRIYEARQRNKMRGTHV